MIVFCVSLFSVGLANVVQDPVEKPAAKQPAASGSKEVSIDEQFVAVDNMHHFMEYICEPSYKGLKAILATEPANRKEWKPFKNHSLVLAETIALVAQRGPKDSEKSKQWKQISLDVHKHATSLYKSSGKYDQAKQHYGSMIDSCNKCHAVFTEGYKYQLEK